MSQHLVAVVAFGKTSLEKISRSLIRLKINYGVLLPHETPKYKPTHIILTGGPMHVYELDCNLMPQWILDTDVPVLGICYGMQLIAHTFGGIVCNMGEKEYGPIDVTEMFNNSQLTHSRWMNRYDRVITLPQEFDITGVTSKNHIAAFTDHKKWWAVQYHPESYKYGDLNVFRRFLKRSAIPHN